MLMQKIPSPDGPVRAVGMEDKCQKLPLHLRVRIVAGISIILWIMLYAVMAIGSPAVAATSSGVLTVQATVVDACSVTGGTLAFGVISPAAGTTSRPNAAFNVTCTQGTAFAVGLGEGLNASAGQRRMRGANGANYIAYDLFRDSSGTQRFGDSVTTQRLTGLTGMGTMANSIYVYGEIPASQNAPSDNYSDTVPITIYY